jgi:hypothetical protein
VAKLIMQKDPPIQLTLDAPLIKGYHRANECATCFRALRKVWGMLSSFVVHAGVRVQLQALAGLA